MLTIHQETSSNVSTLHTTIVPFITANNFMNSQGSAGTHLVLFVFCQGNAIVSPNWCTVRVTLKIKSYRFTTAT